MAKPLTTIQVARMLVQMADRDRPPLIPARLQNLVFMANGWNLALGGMPLVDEDAEAWEHGPVFPKLRNALALLDDEAAVTVTDLPGDPGDIGDPAPHQVQVVVELNRAYGGMPDDDLHGMLCMDGAPWAMAREDAGDPSVRPVIGNGSISRHYASVMQLRGAA